MGLKRQPEFNGVRAIVELVNLTPGFHQVKFVKSGRSVKLYQRYLRLVPKVRRKKFTNF